LLKNLFQHSGIGLFQAKPANFKSLSLKRSGEDGPGTQAISVVMMKNLDTLFTPLSEFPDGDLHCVDQLLFHSSISL
jgi:hypothetical protein